MGFGMRARLRSVVRSGSTRGDGARGRDRERDRELVGRVCSELAADLPDEDVGECLDDAIDMYRMGSKPRCEEVEYLGLVREAIDRIEEGE
ncbi:hypothetical protein F9278_30825 [Streptomyces phaeolivaceus]|uniref:Uncharacterized protein n=1 Tax=Streptomyces phaeolivaceus TaxID=2653200 RepID=A0A5P8K9A9_9ACTN|nr:hypothetical protein F9278_30825 [Streptomyces phaeolivaceus]